MQKYTVKITDHASYWYKEGTEVLHRENDLPAIEYLNGDKIWYLNGLISRKNGPAVEYTDGGKSYWLNGKQYWLKEDWKKALNPNSLDGKTVEIDGLKYKLSLI